MKKTIAIFLIIAALSLQVLARPVKRIVFKKGATKTIVYGNLNGYKDLQIYRIKVRAGQVITVKVEGPNDNHPASVGIESPGGETFWQADLSCHSSAATTEEYSDRENGSQVTVAGDYKISVNECPKGESAWKGKFKLTVVVK